MKANADVALYNRMDGNGKPVGSAKNVGAETNSHQVQRRIYGLDLDGKPVSDLVDVRVVVVQKVSFLLRVPIKLIPRW